MVQWIHCALVNRDCVITRNEIKLVRSLRQKKYRELHRCFIAEGSKLVLDLMNGPFPVRQIFASPRWKEETSPPLPVPVTEISPAEMEKITALNSPSQVLAILEMVFPSPDRATMESDLTLVLDSIGDPGNLGTIIRIADWFGIPQVVCSPGTVDIYNPKVIQATMGSVARVRVIYRELSPFLGSIGDRVPVYALTLGGTDIFHTELSDCGVLILGSEAHGISEELLQFVTRRLIIPFFPASRTAHAESLNAAVAAGIACAEFRRRGS
jgi:TrmH family RNA methyltransferase